jgi:ribonuclease HI
MAGMNAGMVNITSPFVACYYVECLLPIMPEEIVTVYTDGSCNPVSKKGGWVAILFLHGAKIILKGMDMDTTHQRMELMAVLKALEYVEQHAGLIHPIHIYSDSQYVIGIQRRMSPLDLNNFLNKKGKPHRNADLLRKLVDYLKHMSIIFTKVVSHQKKNETENLNREADKIARSIVRGHAAQ